MEPAKPSSESRSIIENITRIDFTIYNDVNRESVFSNQSDSIIPDLYDTNEPIHYNYITNVTNLSLRSLEPPLECPMCGLRATDCRGHFGTVVHLPYFPYKPN
jgi:hypothetical protein